MSPARGEGATLPALTGAFMWFNGLQGIAMAGLGRTVQLMALRTAFT